MRHLAHVLLLCGCVSDSNTTTPDGGMMPVDGSSNADQTASDQVVPLTDVNGTVVDEFGNPTVGAAVRIGTQTAMTDASGKFVLKAEPTYRIEVVHDTTTSSSNKRVLVVNGLTTRTPSIQTLSSAARTGTVNLTLTNVPANVPMGNRIFVWTVPTSKTTDGAQNTIPVNGGTSPTYPGKWQGAAALTGDLTALYVSMTNTDAFPTAFISYGSSPINLSSGSTANVSIPMVSAGQSSVKGAIAYNGSTGIGLQINYRPSGIRGYPFGQLGFNATTFDVPAPKVTAWRYMVMSVALTAQQSESHVWKTNLPNGNVQPVAFSHDGDLGATAPADMATMVDASTNFSWSMRNNAQYAMRAYCGAASNPFFVVDVLTPATSTNIPNTASLGASLGSNASCKWYVTAVLAPSIDDLVAPAGWLRLVNPYFADADGSYLLTKERAFTTK